MSPDRRQLKDGTQSRPTAPGAQAWGLREAFQEELSEREAVWGLPQSPWPHCRVALPGTPPLLPRESWPQVRVLGGAGSSVHEAGESRLTSRVTSGAPFVLSGFHLFLPEKERIE